jgi:hypothetical protein
MKGRRLLIGLLLLATVLVDLVALLSTIPTHDWPGIPERVLFSLALGQISLTATWAVFGRTGLPWRVAGLALLLAACNAGLYFSFPEESVYDVSGFVAFSGTQTALVAGVWIAARLMGVRLIDATADRSGNRPPQFSILSLLACLTAVAVSLGVLQYISGLRLLNQGNRLLGAAPIFGANVAVCVATCWVILGTGGRVLRGVVVPLGTLGVVFACYQATGENYVVVLFGAFQAVWIAASCWVVRVAGYRLGRGR